ncbi:hypothetical protein HER21_28835 [Pseudomonas sp. BGM005]|nr:hypothetical protein [Pseudomonas sp. BG5]
MKKMLPDLLGTAGLCLLVSGLLVLYGWGVALAGGGVLLMACGFLAGLRLRAVAR